MRQLDALSKSVAIARYAYGPPASVYSATAAFGTQTQSYRQWTVYLDAGVNVGGFCMEMRMSNMAPLLQRQIRAGTCRRREGSRSIGPSSTGRDQGQPRILVHVPSGLP